MPDALLAWMQGMDSALSRRLRNLSHAVNVQMLRIGLSQALLPVNLLEAVIAGQLETQASASNLIRLRLPLAMGDLEPGMDVLCVLLRASRTGIRQSPAATVSSASARTAARTAHNGSTATPLGASLSGSRSP